MAIQEISTANLDTKQFIEEQVRTLSETVGRNSAINALSGGVDSSAVTLIGHRALGEKLLTYFIDNGLMRQGKRDFGMQIEIRCWDTRDARRAFPTRLDWETLENLSLRILDEVPGVVSVTYNIASKPPSTMEAV
jgi:GMP synthase PP-ATPase subunit